MPAAMQNPRAHADTGQMSIGTRAIENAVPNTSKAMRCHFSCSLISYAVLTSEGNRPEAAWSEEFCEPSS